jgi:hypothetical protein
MQSNFIVEKIPLWIINSLWKKDREGFSIKLPKCGANNYLITQYRWHFFYSKNIQYLWYANKIHISLVYSFCQQLKLEVKRPIRKISRCKRTGSCKLLQTQFICDMIFDKQNKTQKYTTRERSINILHPLFNKIKRETIMVVNHKSKFKCNYNVLSFNSI